MTQCNDRQDMIASCEFSSNGSSSSSHTIRSIGTTRQNNFSVNSQGCALHAPSDSRSASRYSIVSAKVEDAQHRASSDRRPLSPAESVMMSFWVISGSRCFEMNPGPDPMSSTVGKRRLMSCRIARPSQLVSLRCIAPDPSKSISPCKEKLTSSRSTMFAATSSLT